MNEHRWNSSLLRSVRGRRRKNCRLKSISDLVFCCNVAFMPVNILTNIELVCSLLYSWIYLLTQEAIQQLQRVSVGGQRDKHRGARGFRPPKVSNDSLFIGLVPNIFIGLVQNMNVFQGAPDADLIFGSGKRAPPKWILPEDCCAKMLVIVELYLPSTEGSDYCYICERPVIYRRLRYINVAEMYTKATSRRWQNKVDNIRLEIYVHQVIVWCRLWVAF